MANTQSKHAHKLLDVASAPGLALHYSNHLHENPGTVIVEMWPTKDEKGEVMKDERGEVIFEETTLE